MARESPVKSLSSIVPCKDEGASVYRVMESITHAYTSLNLHGEIIVIDDGSSDNTFEEAKRFKQAEIVVDSGVNIKILRHTVCRGLGYSFFEGVRNAESEFVILIPGDGEICPYHALELFPYLSLHADVIVPYTLNANIRKPYRRIISKLFTRLINMIFWVNFSYTNGSIIWKRSLYLAEALIKLKLIETPVRYIEIPILLDKANMSEEKSSALSKENLIEILKRSTALYIAIQHLNFRRRKSKIITKFQNLFRT